MGDLPASFVEYFRKDCLVRGIARFWCGRGSKARPGHGCSQNLAECTVKIVKDCVRNHAKTAQEHEFMDKLEQRYLKALQPSAGFIRDEIVLAPLPHDRCSLDLLTGSGRAFSSLGENGHHPCAEQILAAQARHGRAMLQVGKYHIMPCHWKRPSQYTVAASQAAALSRMLEVGSGDSCKEALKNNGIIESGDDERERIVWTKLKSFFWVP